MSKQKLMKIPNPKYHQHQAYNKIKTNLLDTFKALKILYPSFIYVWKKNRKKAAPLYQNNQNKTFNELQDQGYTALKVPTDLKQKLLNQIQPQVQKLKTKREGILARKRGVEACLTNLYFRNKNEDQSVLPLVDKIFNELNIYQVADCYLGGKSKIKTINLQINNDEDTAILNVFPDLDLKTPQTVYMHIDSVVNTLKVIIYLNDVSIENGAFRYVTGSHRGIMSNFEKCLRKAMDISGLDSTKNNKRKLFSALPKVFQKKANFGNDLNIEDTATQELLKKEKVLDSSQGDLLFFDNDGIHRGALFTKGERQILQIILVT